MLRSLFTAATGLEAQQMSLDVVANNLANVSTNGFKKSRADFQDLVYQAVRDPGAKTGANTSLPTGAQIGLGVSSGTTKANFIQGTIINTGNEGDIAIKGSGFFKVLLPDGSTAYTRDGSFNVDGSGRLVTSEGYVLQPEVTLPPDKASMSVGADGTVTVIRAGQSDAQTLGKIQITNFVNPAGLKALGGNLFQQTDASGQATDATPGTEGSGTLLNKQIESSNVDVVEEMVRMIIVQRAYESNSKVINSADEMLSTTNNLKR